MHNIHHAGKKLMNIFWLLLLSVLNPLFLMISNIPLFTKNGGFSVFLIVMILYYVTIFLLILMNLFQAAKLFQNYDSNEALDYSAMTSSQRIRMEEEMNNDA